MDSAFDSRDRAELCLRLLQFWTDGSLAGHLSLLAARYHEAALQKEYGVTLHGLENSFRIHDRQR
jgi:hypothetical protein